jgi:hypothetical protein
MKRAMVFVVFYTIFAIEKIQNVIFHGTIRCRFISIAYTSHCVNKSISYRYVLSKAIIKCPGCTMIPCKFPILTFAITLYGTYRGLITTIQSQLTRIVTKVTQALLTHLAQWPNQPKR